MMVKRLVWAFVGLLLVAAPALAQTDEYPRAEFFVGGSYASLDAIVQRLDAGGVEFSLTGNPHKNWGIEGDFSSHFGSVGGVHFQNYLFMAGPRVVGRYERWAPFAHVLFGGNHFSAAGLSTTDFAMAFGGGVDVNGTKHFAVRLGQVDYVYVRLSDMGISANSHNLRVSAGVVVKW